ncbi:vesicular glutamate transporter 2.2-like [Ylistrum balloti]|uniref:vesicular glutamate transporter 2.2-like n=1 Tax=Ylistrum balloti TaxID=509963 RepID=UPI0029058C8E|nr:vesicular glutamate transporter 2.2-like [Ylistrum balloti]
MCCPKRFIVVGLGFVGLLISIGYRAVFAMVMVDVTKTPATTGKCPVNESDSTRYLSLTGKVSVRFSQTMNTAYFVGSLLTQAPGGYLATRFSPSRICGISILLTSVLMLTLPWAIPFNKWLTMAIRFVQGIVEGASVPALNGVISAWAPRSEKARMITISYSGAYLSPTVAFVVTGSASCYISWHASLFIYGGCGVLWSLAWFLFIYDTPASHPGLKEREILLFQEEGPGHRGGSRLIASGIPWRSILTSLPMYAVIVGSFCRNWIFSLILTELPQYFHDVFSLSIDHIGWMTGVPEVFMTLVTIIGGVVVDKLIKANRCGITTTVGRKLAQCIGFGIEAICLFVLATRGDSPEDRTLVFILLCVGVGFSGLAISGYQVNPLDLAPQYSSILTGLSRCGALGAILSTATAAAIRDGERVKNWQTIFWIAGAIHMAGVVFYGIFARGTRQPWAQVKESKGLINPVEGHSEGSENGVYDDYKDRIYSRSVDYGSTRNIEEDTMDKDTIFSKSTGNVVLSSSDYDEGPDWFHLTI